MDYSKNLQNYNLRLSYVNLLTPAHRCQKCARKVLGTHDWIYKLALSCEVVRTTILGRKKAIQLMICIRYNTLKIKVVFMFSFFY